MSAGLVRALVVAGAFAAAALPAAAQLQPRERYTRAELEVLGVQRLSELVQRVDARAGTAEGLSWFGGADHLPAAALGRRGLPEWTILVDGQRVDVVTGGAVFPELIPLSVQQVDSVVVVREPGIVEGSVAPRGVIHIYSRRLAKGLNASGAGRTGSETGDPGPYLATPRTTPNVDRVGFDASGQVGYGGRGWEAEVGVRQTEQSVTDPRLLERFGTKQFQSYTTASGPSLRARVHALGGSHQLLLGGTEQSGFVYIPWARTVERTSVRAEHAGLSGALALGTSFRGTYRLAHSSLRVAKLEDRLAPVPEQRRTTERATLELWRDGGESRVAAGAEAAAHAYAASGAAEVRRLRLTLFALAERGAEGPGWSQRVTAAVVRGGGRLGGMASAAAGWTPDSARSLTASVALTRHIAEGPGDQAPRHLLSRVGAAPSAHTLLWSELVWRERLAGGLNAEFGGVYGFVSEEDGEQVRPPGPFASEAVRGGRAGVRVGVSGNGPGPLSGRLVYQSVSTVGASPVLARAMESIPDHSLAGSLLYSPVPSLQVGLLADVRSATAWTSAAENGGVEPVSRVDLSVQKWFWGKRMRTHLGVQNVLNTPERYHPLGAQFDRRFFLTGVLSLRAAT